MGLLDKVKNVLGSRKGDAATKAPSQALRDAGIDPSALKFAFSSDGSVTINGTIAKEADRVRMVQLIRELPGVQRVIDNSKAAAAAAPAEHSAAAAERKHEAAAPAGRPAEASGAEKAVEELTYTVKSGDTLWKIAKQMYGDGAKYPKIFEANRNILNDPDRIHPGQELRIPKE